LALSSAGLSELKLALVVAPVPPPQAVSAVALASMAEGSNLLSDASTGVVSINIAALINFG
jgi:hypothetical protein